MTTQGIRSGNKEIKNALSIAAPVVLVSFANWGKSPAFDRIWTTLSILLMGLLAMLFAFNYWVA